jgi:hypothetical protein
MRGDTAWVEVSTRTERRTLDVIHVYHALKVIRVERRRGTWVAVREESSR